MILKPQTIAYSWDVFNYYNGNGRPIVVPIVTLGLAASNNSSPANIYIPPYNGNSTTPPHISGYGWAGLNQSSAVTVELDDELLPPTLSHTTVLLVNDENRSHVPLGLPRTPKHSLHTSLDLSEHSLPERQYCQHRIITIEPGRNAPSKLVRER